MRSRRRESREREDLAKGPLLEEIRTGPVVLRPYEVAAARSQGDWWDWLRRCGELAFSLEHKITWPWKAPPRLQDREIEIVAVPHPGKGLRVRAALAGRIYVLLQHLPPRISEWDTKLLRVWVIAGWRAGENLKDLEYDPDQLQGGVFIHEDEFPWKSLDTEKTRCTMR